jgi:hypothetical protein
MAPMERKAGPPRVALELVLRRSLDVINHDNLDWTACRLEFESELFLQRRED